nr:hypothetical protein [Tanacetum cinerariifolium]
MKMEHYLSHTDYPIWQVIHNGNGHVSIITYANDMIKVLPPKTVEEVVARERERKARTTLLMALPEDHLAKFHKMADAKEMWEAIKSRFGSNDESKKMQKYLLKHYCIIIKHIKYGFYINDDDMEKMDLKWQVAMISMRIKKFHKKTCRKLLFDTKDPVSFDKTKVECFNCHKIGHFARDCRAKRNQDNIRRDAGYDGNEAKDNGRRPAYQDDLKALVTIDGEDIDWSGHVNEDVQNYAMMAYSSSNSVQVVAGTDDSLVIPKHTTVETPMNVSPANKAHFEAEKEAMHLILTGIGDEIYSTIDACQTAQEMWEAIERLQKEWSKFVMIVKQQHKLDEVSYHKLFDILKQYQKEVNELCAERLARNANPLALVATAQSNQDPYYQTYKGKEIAKTITPLSETASEEDIDPKQAQRDKDMHKNLALIAKYFKKIYKPTNNNLRTSSKSRNRNVDTTPWENVGSPVVQQSGIQCFNYTDEEIEEHELEVHYSYMAKIQEVPTADTGTDSKPVKQNDQNDVESDDERVALANLKLDVDENKKIQKKLKKGNTTLAQELKECKTILAETSKTLRESNSVRNSCLVAIQNKQTEFEKYKAFNDHTVDYEKLERKLNEALGQLAHKDIKIKEEIHGAGVSHEDANQKFLRSLPFTWSQVALIMRTKPWLDTFSFDDLYNNLRVFKHDVKGTIASSSNKQNVAFVSTNNTSITNDVSTAYGVSSTLVLKSQKEGSSLYTDEVIHSFFANQSSAPQLDYDDLEQINDEDTEEIDLKWQDILLETIELKGIKTAEEEMLDAGYNRNKARDNGRRPAYQDDSKSLVTINGEDIDWSEHVEEDANNYVIMAYSSSNSASDNE